ncbi:MAG: S8 family serine peptidase [Xanthomonadales bacterium]|nr:S8 family serine peptidase [Xanthomonadales bacterium]
MGALLNQNNVVDPAAFGDSYSLAPWLQDDQSGFYLASPIAPSSHTFDGIDESAGTNSFGSLGGTFSVSEGIIDLGGGAERYVVEVSAVDSSLDNEPWVDASWAGQTFTDWILDVGNFDGGGNTIAPGYSFSVSDSGCFVFDSTGASLGTFELYSDTSTSTELSGGAWLELGGSDIAGVDVSTIQLYWDIAPTSEDSDLDLQLVDATDGAYAPGETLEVLNYTENIGGSTSTSYTITYYASVDTTITSGDISLGAEPPRDPLDPGAYDYYLTTVSLPTGLASGDYYIGAILTVTDADANNNVNHDAVPISVSTDPDIDINPLTLDFVQEAPGQTPDQPEAKPLTSPAKITQATLASLTDKLNRNNRVNLIVGLNLSVQAEGKLSQAQVEQQHQGIRTQGDLLAKGLAGLNAQIKRRFMTLPFMALTADQATLDFLTRSPLVASITEDRISKPFMASSNVVIGSPIAWAEGFDGSGWAVAVLDTGVDNTHSWFTTPAGKVVAEGCYGTNNPGFVESWCPGGASSSTAADSGLNCDLSVAGCDHGTHVAGTVAGNDNSGPDFGVARGADIIAMQVFSKFLTADACNPSPAPCTASYSSDQIAAMERVLLLAEGMNIAAVNMSLGGGQYFDQASCDADNAAVKSAIDNLRSVGIATVIAAGNNGWRDSIGSPGCISSAISVGATTDSDAIAGFSNIYPQIHLLAPGVDIDSSLPGNAIGSKQGTSMSTPHVAGAWAVMKQLNPTGTVSDVLSTLQTSATLVDDLRSGGVETAMPRINVDLALGESRTTFVITNDGPVNLSIASIVPETPAAWLSWAPAAPFNVEPGELVIVSVFVDYDLAPDGLVQTRLLVNSNDPDESPYPGGIFVNVTKAPGSAPEFSSTPVAGTTLAFGSIVTSTTSSPVIVSVENLGTADLTLVCNITGANADQFNLVACPNPVSAAGSANISVTCEPSSIGLQHASLDVSTNDADEAAVSYPLTCTGIEAPSGDYIFANSFEGDTIPFPDLVVINPGVSNTSLASNQSYTINATASNQGDGASAATTLRYYLSSDSLIAVDDTPLGTDAIPSLAPGADSAQSLGTNAPGGEGSYWVGACVDAVAEETITDNQCSTAVQINVAAAVDSDNDRLPDFAETNTGIFIDSSNTGTDPNNPDTDGDGIKDGDEVLGTLAGLDLPAMGTNPLRKDLLLEYDWFDDSVDCEAHSHRPSAATIASITAAFSNSPVTNPGVTSGVNLINDYGQGGVFTGGNLIADADGVIADGVSGSDFTNYKAANFAANRNGYFHYVLLPHRYNTSSSSSGQAEVYGDDLIVSLYCANSDGNVTNTIMHEVGHNLNLLHGGNESCNFKPNYNSVMNYKYQFPGVDNDCAPPGDGVLDFSVGDRISLDETNLNEFNGTCGPGFPFDWNENAILENPAIFNINAYDSEVGQCGATLTTLNDYDDWGNILFGGVGDADGAPLVPLQIITEQPVPAEFLNRVD